MSEPAPRSPKLTKTLLLTIALPDIYAEDIQANAAEFFDGSMEEAGHEALMLISSTARVFVMTGDKGGNQLQDARGVIVRYEVVDAASVRDEPEDERLTDALDERMALGEHA